VWDPAFLLLLLPRFDRHLAYSPQGSKDHMLDPKICRFFIPCLTSADSSFGANSILAPIPFSLRITDRGGQYYAELFMFKERSKK
jgi:hypothetical protein